VSSKIFDALYNVTSARDGTVTSLLTATTRLNRVLQVTDPLAE
jgi:hypothetical protein